MILSEKEIRALMSVLITCKILIIAPTATDTRILRQQLRSQISRMFPRVYNGHNSAGYTIYINGYEPLTVHTPESWTEENKKLFGGVALTYRFGTAPDLPHIITPPKDIYEYLEEWYDTCTKSRTTDI